MYFKNVSPLSAPEKNLRIVVPSALTDDKMVVVLGVFRGALSTTRFFPLERPYQRVRFVLTPLSSRKASEAAQYIL